ncbi:hypothetical protein [Vibrio vulnificus]|uniref:hypothetical protein n=1 Tax=Vibrio vulnificus TaxID=672 RepID=UPI003241D9FC
MSGQFQELIDSNRKLTETVETKVQGIDERVETAEQEFNQFMVQARLENAIFRQSKNQYCNVTGTALDYFSRNPTFTTEVTLYRTIASGVPWADRDPEEQEILTAMGMAGKVHFNPAIRVMKLAWSGFQSGVHNSYSIYPNPIGNGSGWVTIASYAKLLSGSISGWWLNGVHSSWALCGMHYAGGPGRYIHAHPYVGSASGEVLFIWPGIVSGYVPLDKNAPKWGYWPSMYGENPYDAQPGS